MSVVITGAAGFLGAALARRLAAQGPVRLIDRVRGDADGDWLVGDLCDRDFLDRAIADATSVVHLAALPGGAAERDPAGSRRVNLDVSLDLLASAPARLIHASTIGVFGAPLPRSIDDLITARPTSVYGTHKRMVELAIADAMRRGRDALSLRLPGLVARPAGSTALASAFMSDVFHALRAGVPFTAPVDAAATMWLMSLECCIDNLLHAIAMPTPARPVLTLPVVRTTMAELVGEIAAQTGLAACVTYRPDPNIVAGFGRLPPLEAAAARDAGFVSDGDVPALVARTLAGLGA